MRTSILALCLVTLAGSPALAGYVIHDGAPGIVAFAGGSMLDSNGVVWMIRDGEWRRVEELYPDQYWWILPVPVQDIKFWDGGTLLTVNNEYFQYGVGVDDWTSFGFWPDLPASVEGESEPRPGAAVSPNPSTGGSCRIAFSVVSGGPVSVEVVEVSGRVVRHLLNGPHPAGEYRLEWDGKDDSGRELPAGVYLTRIETGESVTTGRAVLAR